MVEFSRKYKKGIPIWTGFAGYRRKGYELVSQNFTEDKPALRYVITAWFRCSASPYRCKGPISMVTSIVTDTIFQIIPVQNYSLCARVVPLVVHIACIMDCQQCFSNQEHSVSGQVTTVVCFGTESFCSSSTRINKGNRQWLLDLKSS